MRFNFNPTPHQHQVHLAAEDFRARIRVSQREPALHPRLVSSPSASDAEIAAFHAQLETFKRQRTHALLSALHSGDFARMAELLRAGAQFGGYVIPLRPATKVAS